MPLPAEGHTIDLSNPLDMLYLNGDKTELEKALKLFRKNGGLKRYRLAQSDNVQKVLEEIAAIGPDKISPILYESYSENLRKAVDQVYKKDDGSGLSDRLRANVSRFAAYKALKVTREVQQKLGDDLDEAKRVLRIYNRHQATEYNTTISRSRTAKQFEQFNDPDNVRLFPNLRWLPSRSADPREQHMLFYNKVWEKGDDFWTENTPGSLWNCKCDWEETDDPVTQGNPKGNKSAKGLKGNPVITGKVFTEDHPYYNINIEGLKEKNIAWYELLKADTSSYMPEYVSNEGGLLLSNLNRMREGRLNRNEREKFAKEHDMCLTLAKNNYRIVYLETVEGSYDITINGHAADLKKLSSSNNIVKKANHAIQNQGAEIVIFEFSNFDSKHLVRLDELARKGYKVIWYKTDSTNELHYININL